ncbi:MAG: DNA-directed RNA polymerase subunit beta' [Pseudomonadota bacterium]
MSQKPPSKAQSLDIIAELARPSRMADQHPIAGRFIYALRLVALHDRVGRDPIPELATRLGGVELAAKALSLAQAIKLTWPENIHISRFCCGLLSHDEATIANLVSAVIKRDRKAFDHTIEGLVRPDRMERLWECASDLATAELSGL